MSTVTFYTNPMSRGQIVRWALHEVGAEYEQVLLEYDTTMKEEAYLDINPMGKVPAIVHNDQVVTECGAICAYLAEAFPASKLAPALEERADYFRWMFFTAGPLEAAVTNRSLGFEVRADQERMAGFGNYERTVTVLDDMLQSRQYVCGDRFTMADVFLGAHVTWGMEFKSLPERDGLKAYSSRVTQRAAYGSARAVDMELISGATNRTGNGGD
jgi:glutathione S-transferase